jgi:NAD(P)-dependent dehydrogenase (short-subunit alcohol dehydrogenase family)
MDRKILITGANNGIGLAMTRSLLAMGDCVAALDLAVDHLDAANPGLLPFVCDVTDPARVQSVVDEVVRRWGGVDVLVNNACLALFKRFDERTIGDIRREMEVNFYGDLNLIQAVLPVMLARGKGVIHNVSSGVGYTGMPGMTGYTASKGAIESLTRTLALEYAGQGITFNVMHPPLTRTPASAGLGVPPEMMADPEVVGRRFARLVGKTRSVLAPGVMHSIQLWISYHMPYPMGKLMSMMAEKARQAQTPLPEGGIKE